MNRPAKENPTGHTPQARNSFPLVAVLHLTTLFALLCGCLSPANLTEMAEQWREVVGAAVAAVLFGAFVGVCVGLGAVRRLPACLYGAGVGAAAGLLAVGLIGSGNPGRLLFACVAILLAPLAIRHGHD